MYLGIDIGTSAVKALIVDEDGQVRAQAQTPLTISLPRPLWSEQDPARWWETTQLAVKGLDPALRKAVRAIGLSGQMHGATLLDDADRVLRPAILWNDGRSAAQCRELERKQPQSRIITGNVAMPGFTAPKLLWIQQHEPDLFRRLRRVLLPKDYVRLCVTGEHATDVSDAAGTLWLDVARRQWSAEMLAATDLDESYMPRLLEGTESSGTLRAQMSVMLSAAACVDWVARLAGYPDVSAAMAAAENAQNREGSEIFLPYLSGERTPHNNPHAQGVFFGLTHDTDSAALVRAVLEGVALAMADGADALREAGVKLKRLSVIGGGSGSPYWGRLLAAALQLPLDCRTGSSLGPAYGAARLARLALTSESPAEVCAPPSIDQIIEADSALVDSLQLKRAIFRKIYSQLETVFPK